MKKAFKTHKEFINEMALGDIHAKHIIDHYKKADKDEQERCAEIITGDSKSTVKKILKDILEMGYKEIQEIEAEIFEK
jgi:putative IMPACT (imprinted ancient) family translation regulator